TWLARCSPAPEAHGEDVRGPGAWATGSGRAVRWLHHGPGGAVGADRLGRLRPQPPAAPGALPTPADRLRPPGPHPAWGADSQDQGCLAAVAVQGEGRRGAGRPGEHG